MVTEQEHDAATERGQQMLRDLPRATAVHFEPANRQITIALNRGFSIAFSPERSQDLANATPEQLGEVEISHPGFSIYFPRLDADLWVPSLVQGRFGNDHWESEWAAAHQHPNAA